MKSKDKSTLMKHRLLLLLSAVVLTASPRAALASGSYTSRPPQPGAAHKSLDRAKYSLGQRLFHDKVKLDAQADPTAQRDRLKALQARLPKRVSKKKDLLAMAGKLAAEQLEALEYYVNQRFHK
jgi:hypothetical protein